MRRLTPATVVDRYWPARNWWASSCRGWRRPIISATWYPPVVQHVLSDIEDGRYHGFPELGLHTQSLENASFKRLTQIPPSQTGVLITQVAPGAAAHGHLMAGDILAAINQSVIGDDGTVALRPGERTHFAEMVQRYQVGETLVAEVIRSGMAQRVRIPLVSALGTSALVPAWRYDRGASYYIYGGLVFCSLTLDYLRTWGAEWYDDAPAELLNLYQHGVKTVPGEEVVIVIKVLASAFNTGYDAWINQRITAVNQQPIRNLRELIWQVEQSEETFTRFETSQHLLLVIDREQAAATHQDLLETYDIARDRSPDLEPDRVEGGLHLSAGH